MSLLPLALLLATGCAPELPAWRTLFYVAADNNLEYAAVANMTELGRAPAEEGLAVGVELDRARGYSRAWGDWVGARRYVVAPTHPTGATWGRAGRGWTFETQADLGETDMSDPARLADFLRWADEDLPAKNTLLVLWVHGQGSGGALADGPDLTWMEVDELAAVLEAHPVDVLAMDMCAMQSLGVAARFADGASYLVGTATQQAAQGWGAPAVLDAVRDASPAEAALMLADNARTQEIHTVSALDLTQVGALAVEWEQAQGVGAASWESAPETRLTPDTVDLGAMIEWIRLADPVRAERLLDRYDAVVLSASSAGHAFTGLSVEVPHARGSHRGERLLAGIRSPR